MPEIMPPTLPETLTPQPFTYRYLEWMLNTAIQAGYVVSSFEKYTPTDPRTVILRHDVDYTVDGVLNMAKVEADLGCSATYLFRVHADNYNVFSCIVWTLMQDLRALGHEIGLHFESMTVGRALQQDPPTLLRQAKTVLETVLGHPIKTASEHREISSVIHQTPVYDTLHDPYEAGFDFYAMDPRYCKAMKYLSDSNANWREGDLLQHLNAHDRFQMLIHPDWWFEKDFLLKGAYHHPLELATE